MSTLILISFVKYFPSYFKAKKLKKKKKSMIQKFILHSFFLQTQCLSLLYLNYHKSLYNCLNMLIYPATSSFYLTVFKGFKGWQGTARMMCSVCAGESDFTDRCAKWAGTVRCLSTDCHQADCHSYVLSSTPCSWSMHSHSLLLSFFLPPPSFLLALSCIYSL